MRTGNMPRLSLPTISTRNPAPLDQHRRLTLIRQAVTDEQIPAIDRVAALLLLLYAQPVTRIVRLTLDDIAVHDGQVLLRLGVPPTPAPEPFATLLLDYTATRPNTKTATSPASRWLFPDAAQTSRSAPAPSSSDCATSASHRAGPAPQRSASSPCRPRRPHARLPQREPRHHRRRGRRPLEPATPPGDHTR